MSGESRGLPFTELGIALLYIVTMGHAGIEKLLTPQTPQWFLDQFSATFLNVFEGSLSIQYYGIGVIEAVIATLLITGLLVRAPLRDKLIRSGLLLSFYCFIALGFGLRITAKYDGAASLFVYAAVTFFVIRAFDNRKVAAR